MRKLLLPLLLLAGAAHAQGSPHSSARDRAAVVDQLLAALKAAPSEEVAGPLELRITQIWIESGSPAATLLMIRGIRDMKSGAHDDAVDDFDSVVALEPDLAEGWSQRGVARFAAGDMQGAIADISEALKRDPRHFTALQALSRIAESRQDWTGALAAWEKVLEIDPKTPDGVSRLKDLRRRALGDDT
jgi:tetratricopeptide (TPR) repeat protein